MAKRSDFTEEDKKQIVKLIIEEGKKVKDISKIVGVSESSIRRWMKQYGKESSFNKGKVRLESEKIFKFRKETTNLKEKREILKKTIIVYQQ